MSKKVLENAISILAPFLGGTDNEAFVGQLSNLVEPFSGAPAGKKWDEIAFDAITQPGDVQPYHSVLATVPERQIGRLLNSVHDGGLSTITLLKQIAEFCTDSNNAEEGEQAVSAEARNRLFSSINFLYDSHEDDVQAVTNATQTGGDTVDDVFREDFAIWPDDLEFPAQLLVTERNLVAMEHLEPGPSTRLAYRDNSEEGAHHYSSMRRVLGLPAQVQEPGTQESASPARRSSKINADPGNPNKNTSPSLSTILVKDRKLQYCVRDSGSAHVFLNMMDSMTMSKASPYFDMKLISARSPTTSDNRVTSTSLIRFLNGISPISDGDDAPDSVLVRGLPIGIRKALGDPTDGNGQPIDLSVTGMELFTSPATLTNANEPKFSSEARTRAAPVLDKLTSFATISKFTVTVTPAGGPIVHKTATMELILHDRSRLSELAEFVKPALYSSTQLLVEYGWSHPDGHAASTDVKAKFINALRQKEKYQVYNSSFSFGDAGEVTITVHLSMMASNDIDDTLISDGPDIQNAHREIQRFIRAISRHRELINPSGGAEGVQGETWVNSMSSVRAAAQINTETEQKMVEFRNALNESLSSNGTIQIDSDTRAARLEVLDAIDGLLIGSSDQPRPVGTEAYHPETGDITGRSNKGALSRLSTSIDEALRIKGSLLYGHYGSTDPFFRRIYRRTSNRESITAEISSPKVAQIQSSTQALKDGDGDPDIFTLRHILTPSASKLHPKIADGDSVQGTSRERFLYDDMAIQTAGTGPTVNNQSEQGLGWIGDRNDTENPAHWIDRNPLYVSLGKLMLLYVGQPLADKGKYDEIQFIFYNFNEFASYVKDFSIAEFPINTRLFQIELENRLKASSVMGLREFLGFLSSKFVRDPAADAWGLNDLYKIDSSMNRTLRNEDLESANIQKLREARLADAYSPSKGGEPTQRLLFRPPSLQMVTEVVPLKEYVGEQVVENSVKTLLKIHIYDKQATAYRSQGELIAGSRADRITAIRAEARENIDGEGNQSSTADFSILTAAIEQGILEPLPEIENVNKDSVSEWAKSQDPRHVRVKGGFDKLKHFIKKTMPSVTYGSQNSAITSAQLSSQNDSGLASIQMMRQNQGSVYTSADAIDRGVPITVSPMQLSVETFGFPFFRFTQQIFFDFGTGTTVDNIYAVAGIEHSLSPGEFKTSVTFYQQDGLGQYEGMTSQLERVLNAAPASNPDPPTNE